MIALKLLLLIIIANGAALLGTTIFRQRFAWPLDCGLTLADGRRLLGEHTTIRGVLLAEIVTTLAAPLLGLPLTHGLLIGFTAMAGDAFSSFVKRRMGIVPGGRALALDQIPESLLPLLAVAGDYQLTIPVIVGLCLVFLVFELAVSRLLFRLGWRERPY